MHKRNVLHRDVRFVLFVLNDRSFSSDFLFPLIERKDLVEKCIFCVVKFFVALYVFLSNALISFNF